MIRAKWKEGDKDFLSSADNSSLAAWCSSLSRKPQPDLMAGRGRPFVIGALVTALKSPSSSELRPVDPLRLDQTHRLTQRMCLKVVVGQA